MTASLIGCLGQARFPFLNDLGSLIRVTLLFAVCFGVRKAPLHACVGSVVESPASRRASSYAADIFVFIHKPRPDWTIPSDWWLAIGSCRASHLFLTEFRAVDPHAMHQDGEFTGYGHNGAAAAFGPHQTHSPRLDL